MSSNESNGVDPRAQALAASYGRAGYAPIAPPVLQPVEPFVELGGEDIRRRMVFASEVDGSALCLRPDLTIAVARAYLASHLAGQAANFCCLGPVFRRRDGANAEFVQADVVSFGRHDTAAADAEMLALGLEATAHYGVDAPDIHIGDVGLFAALVAALDLVPVWKRRLVRDFNRKPSLTHDLDQLTAAAPNGAPDYQAVLAALAGAEPEAAHRLVAEVLSLAGVAATGDRAVRDVTERFLDQVALQTPTRLPQDIRALIERFLAVGGDPDEAAGELRALASDAKIALEPALDRFETRTGFLAARGVDVRAIKFATGFGRDFDYYTGFVFELQHPRATGALVGGGRYDTLLKRLGAGAPIPAVGFAASIATLAACGAPA
jgi:ATP phosphoribosyltransferase regulatory subunit